MEKESSTKAVFAGPKAPRRNHDKCEFTEDTRDETDVEYEQFDDDPGTEPNNSERGRHGPDEDACCVLTYYPAFFRLFYH